jgi:hypothetical protein
MGSTRFSSRAERYGVGKRGEKDRPHGVRAVILNRDFVLDLIAGLPDAEGRDGDGEPATEDAADILPRAKRNQSPVDTGKG